MSRMVTTVCGNTVPKDKTKLIAGKYYLPGVSCFPFIVNGKERYYRINSPYIAYDYSENKYMLKKLIKFYGIVGLENGIRPIFGRFSKKATVGAVTSENGIDFATYPILSESILEDKWPEDLATGVFYDPVNAPADIKKKRKVNYANLGIDYNANQGNRTFTNAVEAYRNAQIEVSDKVRDIAHLFGNYSFGIEFETSTGTIPFHKLGPLGIMPLRDGSIAGYEYTTVPLSGEAGIQTIVNICQELQKRCLYDQTCSMHVHFGNIDTSPEYLVALYTVCRKIQAEMFDLVPNYKKDPVNIAKLRKNYCQLLGDIGIVYPKGYGEDAKVTEKFVMDNFNNLLAFMGGGTLVPYTPGKKMAHPQGEQKWNRTNRYHWINFIPAVFDNKTVEFRLHAGTFNYDKVLLWMFLAISILEYTKRNMRTCHKLRTLSLNTVIEEAGSMRGTSREHIETLKKYVAHRKKFFQTCAAEGDVLGKTDVSLDAGKFSISLFRHVPENSRALLFDAFYLGKKKVKPTSPSSWVEKLRAENSEIPKFIYEEA